MGEPHPALDAAHEHGLPVAAEVVLGARPEEREDPGEAGGFEIGVFLGALGGDVGLLDVLEEGLGHPLRRQDVVHRPGGDRGLGHLVVLRGLRVLHHDHAAGELDRREPQHSVAAGAGEENPDRLLLLVLGERALRGGEADAAVPDGEVAAGWNDVDPVGFDRLAVLRLGHRHGGHPRQQLGHHALVVGIEVGDEDERHAAPGRHRREEALEGVEAAGRGANPDDQRARRCPGGVFVGGGRGAGQPGGLRGGSRAALGGGRAGLPGPRRGLLLFGHHCLG